MSTSEHLPLSAELPETANWATPLHASEGLTPGLPAPAELARMANELFNALPEALQQPVASAAAAVLPPNSAFSGNPYAAVPSPTAPRFQVRLRDCWPVRPMPSLDPSLPRRIEALRRTCARPLQPRRFQRFRAGDQRAELLPRRGRHLHFCKMRGHSLLSPMQSLRRRILLHNRLAAPCPPTRDLRRFLRRCLPIFSPRRLLSLCNLRRQQFLALWA